MPPITPEILGRLWAALQEPAPAARRPSYAPDLEREILKSGWAYRCTIEDLIFDYEPRLYGTDVVMLAKAFGFTMQDVCKKMPRYATSVFVNAALSATDVAGLLIVLEELGFSTRPDTLVRALLPAVNAQTLLRSGEFRIHMYDRVGGKREVSFTSGGAPTAGETEHAFATASGYKVWCMVEGNRVRRLTVRGPRYRRPSPQSRRTCSECGYEYTSGDPESTYGHRKFHRKEMRILAPVGNPRLALEARDSGLVYVPFAALKWLHALVYDRAVRFKREMHFDFIQYPLPGKMRAHPETIGVLFVNESADLPDGAVLGATAFVRQKETWRMNWIWVAPGMRRRGVLAARWEVLRMRFGKFEVEPPLSDAMQAFLRMHA